MGVNDRAQDKKSEAKARRQATQPKTDGWRGFVALELTEEQKTVAKGLRADPDRLWENVFGMIDDGYKLSFSYDGYNGAYMAAATCQDKSSRNHGLTLTARGGNVLGAVAALWCKHDMILDRVWDGQETSGPRKLRDDDLG